MSDTLLAAEHLYRHYGRVSAVQDISFNLARGQILGLLGPNGAGKSTTLRMLAGLLAPSAGRVWLLGADLQQAPPRLRAALGYLPAQPPLYPELRVAEYLAFCARLRGLRGAAVAAAVARVCEQCGLSTVAKRVIGQLSRGYQQRVGIAQAIIHEPAVVILDEPTVGLDPVQIQEIRSLITALSAHHALILSTHILPEAQALCSQVLIIKAGRAVLSETRADLAARLHTDSLLLGLRRPPPLAQLQALPGVSAVAWLDAQRLRVQHHPDASLAESLAASAAAGDWGLFELIPEQRSLEHIFVELAGDDTLPGAD